MAKDNSGDAGGEPRLYLMTPPVGSADAFTPALIDALNDGGVACVLLTLEKQDAATARATVDSIAAIVQARGVALLIDADPDLAAEARLDGAHMRGGEPIAAAIARLKPDRIVGVGGLRGRHDSMSAAERDVDYVMFGEPKPDGWTPPLEEIVERVAWWAEMFNTPCVAFAPSLDAVAPLAAAGADFIALGAAAWNDARGPGAALRDAVQALEATTATP